MESSIQWNRFGHVWNWQHPLSNVNVILRINTIQWILIKIQINIQLCVVLYLIDSDQKNLHRLDYPHFKFSFHQFFLFLICFHSLQSLSLSLSLSLSIYLSLSLYLSLSIYLSFSLSFIFSPYMKSLKCVGTKQVNHPRSVPDCTCMHNISEWYLALCDKYRRRKFTKEIWTQKRGNLFIRISRKSANLIYQFWFFYSITLSPTFLCEENNRDFPILVRHVWFYQSNCNIEVNPICVVCSLKK